MRRFSEFLAESRIDEELDKASGKIYSIDVPSGKLLFEGTEDGDIPGEDFEEEDPFQALADEILGEVPSGEDLSEEEEPGDSPEEYSSPEGPTTKKPPKGWGGEVYASLDFPELDGLGKALLESKGKKTEDKDEGEEGELKGSATYRELVGRKREFDRGNREDKSQVIKRNTRWDVSSDGKKLLKRGSDGKMRPVTPEEAEKVVLQKTKNPMKKGNKVYRFGSDGTLWVGKIGEEGEPEEDSFVILGKRFRKKFLKTLNDKVNSEGIHYRWQKEPVETKTKGGKTKTEMEDVSRLEVNVTPWFDAEKGEVDDPRDSDRFSKAEYEPLGKDGRENVLKVVNAASGKKPKPGKWASLEWKDGKFFLGGEPIAPEELRNLAISLNGNVGGDTKLLGKKATKKDPSGWESSTAPYWESYKISVAGSKIGNAINFNLPPGETCASGVPCISQGCYALKAYAAYPASRAAMDCNLALLREDAANGFELFKKSMHLACTTPKKGGGSKFTLCRIHVNGDLGIGGEGEGLAYLRAIFDVAKNAEDVHFWMYTKQYGILSKISKDEVPKNLCIIVSCWGTYNPFQLMENGKYYEKPTTEAPYAKLAMDYPLAYLLDEGSEEFDQLNDVIQKMTKKDALTDKEICPCTKAEEIITRCESCKICWDKSLADRNLMFKKH